MQARPRTNKRDDWTLWDMLRIRVDDKPIVQPGELTLTYDKVDYSAKLLNDGIIRYRNHFFYTPSGFSSHVIARAQRKKLIKTRNKATSDGWKMVKYNNEKLDVLRKRAGITTKRTKARNQPSKRDMIERIKSIQHRDQERDELKETILKRVHRIQNDIVLIYDYLIRHNKVVDKINRLNKEQVYAKTPPAHILEFKNLWKRLQNEYGTKLKGIRSLKLTLRVEARINRFLTQMDKEYRDAKCAKRRIVRKFAEIKP